MVGDGPSEGGRSSHTKRRQAIFLNGSLAVRCSGLALGLSGLLGARHSVKLPKLCLGEYAARSSAEANARRSMLRVRRDCVEHGLLNVILDEVVSMLTTSA